MKDPVVFSVMYNYTDCLAMTVHISLHHVLTTMTLGAAYASGIIESSLWAIITPTPTGYKVALFEEEK